MTEVEAREKLFLTVDFADASQATGLIQIAVGLHGLKLDSHQKLPLKSLAAKASAHGVKNIYIDAKASDGPDQMPLTIEKGLGQGAQYLSVEVAAGAAALRAAVQSNQDRLNLVGITIASDMPEEDCLEMYGHEPASVVAAMASIAAREGLRYITCSAHEIPVVRSHAATRHLKVIATGIRMPGEHPNDQIRIASPAEALAYGADLLLVGRSITNHPDPEQALAHITENMKLASLVETR